MTMDTDTDTDYSQLLLCCKNVPLHKPDTPTENVVRICLIFNLAKPFRGRRYNAGTAISAAGAYETKGKVEKHQLLRNKEPLYSNEMKSVISLSE